MRDARQPASCMGAGAGVAIEESDLTWVGRGLQLRVRREQQPVAALVRPEPVARHEGQAA